MALADDIADRFVSEQSGAEPAAGAESPGQMLIAAVKAGDAAGVEAAVRACMESTQY